MSERNYHDGHLRGNVSRDPQTGRVRLNWFMDDDMYIAPTLSPDNAVRYALDILDAAHPQQKMQHAEVRVGKHGESTVSIPYLTCDVCGRLFTSQEFDTHTCRYD